MHPDKFLRIVPLFKPLGPEDTRRLAASVRSQSLKKGRFFSAKGAKGQLFLSLEKEE
jgi:hypothetical protein